MKRPYTPPKLTTYGNLTEMTLGMMGGKKMEGLMKLRT
jgi:hypothetical protein